MYETKDPAALLEVAARCRRLVRCINDQAAETALLDLAKECEREAIVSDPKTAYAASPALALDGLVTQ